MIGVSLGYVAVYVVLVGVASFIESPVGRGFGALQLNALIRAGSLIAAVVALVAAHGLTLPATRSVFAGLGVGLITGGGSLFYCFALNYLPVSSVVTFSNLYIVITTLLGIVVLGEPITALKVTGLSCTVAGVVLLGHAPARYGINSGASSGTKARPVRAFVIMAAYVVTTGVGAFLEKPALRGLDATQLNGLMAIAMTAVAAVALTTKGPRLPMTKRSLAGIGVGAMIGVASVFYFLGLHGLPVSTAAATSNAYIVVTVALSSVFLRQPLTRARGGAIALTLLGVTQLALSAG
ncbi:MAG: DMT family transporter [Actinobacteria bacterium]|nr:DMT family transporter [Actinomycetota bacterium]